MKNISFSCFEKAKEFAVNNSLIAGMCEYFIYQNDDGDWEVKFYFD